MIPKFLGLFSFFIYLLSFQVKATNQSKASSWLGFMSKKMLEEKSALWTEVQLRYDNNDTAMHQTLFRFGYLFAMNERNEVGIILGYIQTGLLKEYRPTLQHIFTFSQSKIDSISLRSRLEARQIEDNPDFSIRYRAGLRWQHSLPQNYAIVIWDEPFVNLTDDKWTGNRFFERNRAFIGTRKKLDGLDLEFGYLNQFVPRNDKDITEHILTVYLNY